MNIITVINQRGLKRDKLCESQFWRVHFPAVAASAAPCLVMMNFYAWYSTYVHGSLQQFKQLE
jgi:hypothetical protein